MFTIYKKREHLIVYAAYYQKETHFALRRVSVMFLIYLHFKYSVLHSYSAPHL